MLYIDVVKAVPQRRYITPPLLKKPTLRLYPLIEKKEKEKKSSIWRLIAMPVNVGLIAVL